MFTSDDDLMNVLICLRRWATARGSRGLDAKRHRHRPLNVLQDNRPLYDQHRGSLTGPSADGREARRRIWVAMSDCPRVTKASLTSRKASGQSFRWVVTSSRQECPLSLGRPSSTSTLHTRRPSLFTFQLIPDWAVGTRLTADHHADADRSHALRHPMEVDNKYR